MVEKQGNIVVVLYETSSVQRLVDAAKIVYGLGFRNFVAIKPYGAAAQNGIPEVTKIALKNKKNFHVLASLEDLATILGIEEIVVISSDYGKRISEEELQSIGVCDKRVAIVVGGTETSIGRNEASKGITIYPALASSPLGPLGELAIILYLVRRMCFEITENFSRNSLS